MTVKTARIIGQGLYGIAILVLFIALLMLSGGSGFAAEAGGSSGDEFITFETLSSNATTGFATLGESYTYAAYEFTVTGTADKEVHIKHRNGNTSRFTNATTNTIKLPAGKYWLHRVVLKNDDVKSAKIQCVSGCATGETITTRGTYK